MKKGFTLIEMIVAIAVFTVVMTITLATYLNVSDIQRKAAVLRSINDNLNFALEVMSRELSQGKNYNLNNTSSCTVLSPCSSFKFKFFDRSEGAEKEIEYSLNSNSIERTVDGVNALFLTSPDIKINNLAFIAKGQDPNDNLQPIMTIIINGSAGEKIKIETHFNVQTSISQRQSE